MFPYTFFRGQVYTIWGFPKIRGYLFGGPNNKDYSILGSILGSPYFGKLLYSYMDPLVLLTLDLLRLEALPVWKLFGFRAVFWYSNHTLRLQIAQCRSYL